MSRVGVVGLGLVGAGFEVAGCDRDRAKASALAAIGLTPCGTPAAVAEDCRIVVLSLPDSAAAAGDGDLDNSAILRQLRRRGSASVAEPPGRRSP